MVTFRIYYIFTENYRKNNYENNKKMDPNSVKLMYFSGPEGLRFYLKSDNIETVSDGHNDVSLDGFRGVLLEVQLVDQRGYPTADLKHLGLK